MQPLNFLQLRQFTAEQAASQLSQIAMHPSLALTGHRTQIRQMTGRFRLINPRVFGSVTRGTDSDASDLDLLVDALPGASLLDVCGLQVELEDLLGVRVDVVTPGDLPARFREQVLAEAQAV